MSRVSLQRTTPILRIFDERKAGEFHVQFLGFAIDWEHRFEPGSLLHVQVSRGARRQSIPERRRGAGGADVQPAHPAGGDCHRHVSGLTPPPMCRDAVAA